MPSKPKSPIDERIDAGEVYIAPTRRPSLGRPCGAKTRHNQEKNGGFCQQGAGHGTDHLGEGRCQFHGGSTPRSHGRYSRLKLKAVSNLLEEHITDTSPLDLLPDLAAARALFENYINTYEELQEAMTAWYASHRMGVDGPRPSKIPDLDEARKMLDTIAGIVTKVEKIRSDGTISRPDFYRLMTEMGKVVEMTVSDDEEKELVKRRWSEIRLA